MAAIKPVQFAASILSADFCRLGEQVEEAMKAGIRLIHVDVMAYQNQVSFSGWQLLLLRHFKHPPSPTLPPVGGGREGGRYYMSE